MIDIFDPETLTANEENLGLFDDLRELFERETTEGVYEQILRVLESEHRLDRCSICDEIAEDCTDAYGDTCCPACRKEIRSEHANRAFLNDLYERTR